MATTSTATTVSAPAALEAYEPLAPHYDQLTASYAHDRWIDVIDQELSRRRLGGPKVLDAACGTGASSLPWRHRGYEVAACDLSPRMVTLARERLQPVHDDEVFVADICDLPVEGDYDLVCCLDDATNYLLTEADLGRALRSMGEALRPGGSLVFDCNTLALYRQRFIGSWEETRGETVFRWEGSSDGPPVPGSRFTARLEVWARNEPGLPLASTTHSQRHHPPDVVRDALEAAGLELVQRFGQHTGARLVPGGDDDRHPKLLYLARRPDEGGPT